MTKVRWVILVLALILAVLATAGVYLSSRGVEGPKESGRMGAVVISEVDIPPRTDLNELIKHDHFRLILIPEDALVAGAITSIDQLRDGHNCLAILAGEQISAGPIKGPNEICPG